MFNISIEELLINIPITLIALTFHELAHGWVSTKLGDPTPKFQGRMTLNPLAHLDLFGTILMIFTGFGWAKPVEVNARYYKNPKRGMALVGIAGPIANLLLAFVGMIIWVLPYAIMNFTGKFYFNVFTDFFDLFMSYFIIRNLSFMIFNLIPIPPLDGSRVISMFLSNKAYYTLMSYERYSIFLIMALSLTGVFDVIILNGVSFVWDILAKSVTVMFGMGV